MNSGENNVIPKSIAIGPSGAYPTAYWSDIGRDISFHVDLYNVEQTFTGRKVSFRCGDDALTIVGKKKLGAVVMRNTGN